MSDRHKRSQHFRFLFAAGVSGIALAVCGGPSAGQTSEIESYEAAVKAAVTSQSKAEALNFIKNFGSSHLVGDLIASLPPAVAQQVCGDLQGGGPAKARKACASLRQLVAVQPVVSPAEIASAAGSAPFDPVSVGPSTPAGVSADDEPAGEQGVGHADDMAGTGTFYQPVTPAPAAAGSAAASPVSSAADVSAGVSPAADPVSPAVDKPEGELDAGDTDSAGIDLFYVPDAETTPGAGGPVVDPVSTAADTSADASSDDEPEIEQDAAITGEAGAGLLYLPATAVAPAAGSPAAAPESRAVTSTTSARSGDEPRGGHGNGDRDNPKDIILQTASTLTTTSFSAVPSVSTSISAPVGVPSVDEPDTSNVQSGSALSSSDQNSSAQSSSGPSSNDQSESTKSGSTKSAQSSGSTKSDKTKSGNTESAQSSSNQSGSTQAAGDQSSSGKGKSDKGKNGKGKGGKDNSGKNKG
jgi:hypothetical protein